MPRKTLGVVNGSQTKRLLKSVRRWPSQAPSCARLGGCTRHAYWRWTSFHGQVVSGKRRRTFNIYSMGTFDDARSLCDSTSTRLPASLDEVRRVGCRYPADTWELHWKLTSGILLDMSFSLGAAANNAYSMNFGVDGDAASATFADWDKH